MQTAQPISDMRASASYRKAMLGEMLFRFWHRHSSPDAPNGLSVQSSWIDGAVS
jgi:xanthine dehydrogenase iron-sulfur cluster and FAD-binding subunit A